MGLGDYGASLAFLESTSHELHDITRLLSTATEFIDSRLSCSPPVRLPLLSVFSLSLCIHHHAIAA
jgi:hypothetical protein